MNHANRRVRQVLSNVNRRAGDYRWVVPSSCLIGLFFGLALATLNRPSYEAVTLVHRDPAAGVMVGSDAPWVLSIPDSVHAALSVELLAQLDVSDKRLHTVYAENAFEISDEQRQLRLGEGLNLSVSDDTIFVKFRSPSSFEAQFISKIAAENLLAFFPVVSRGTDTGNFKMTLERLVSERRTLLAASSPDSIEKTEDATSIAAQLELETLEQLLGRLEKDGQRSSRLKIAELPALPLLPERESNARLVLLAMLAGACLGFPLAGTVNIRRPYATSIHDLNSNNFDWSGSLSSFRVSPLGSAQKANIRSPIFLKPGKKSELHPLVPLFTELVSRIDQPMCVLVSGVGQKVGTSLVALNLSNLAAKVGLRVLLIDNDYGVRKLSRDFSPASTLGFNDVIWGEVSLGKAIKTTTVSNLDFLPVGITQFGLPPVGRELASVIELVRRRYDLVVFDGGDMSEGVTCIEPVVDAVVTVLRRGTSTKHQLRSIERARADQCHLALLNDVVDEGTKVPQRNWRLSNSLPFRIVRERTPKKLELVAGLESGPSKQRSLNEILAPYRQKTSDREEDLPVSL